MKKYWTALLLTSCALGAWGQIRPNEIRVACGNEDYAPYQIHVNGKLTGLVVDVVEAVAAKMEHKVVWNELPWARAQKCAEEGECDAISYLTPNPEREKWGIFQPGNSLLQTDRRFMIHKSNTGTITYNGNVQTFLNGKTLLSVIGYNYGPDVAKAKKYEVKDLITLAAMLTDKRYDLAVISSEDFIGLKSHDDLVLLDPPFWVSKYFIAFSKKANNSVALSAKFQAAYADFKKTKEYSAILNRYKK